jgi:hypothetical protein
MFVKVRDRVVLVNNVTALNKLASEIGRDAVKVINDSVDTPMICIILYKSLDTHKKKKTHMVVTKNKDGMDLYTMRENDNYN